MKGNLLMRLGLLTFLLVFGLHSAPSDANPGKEILKLTDPSIGRVVVEGKGKRWSGSGFVIGTDPSNGDLYFVSNDHVMEGGERGEIGFKVGEEVIFYTFKIISSSKELDLTVVRVSMKGQKHRPPSISIGSYELEKGDSVFALGFPGVSSKYLADRGSAELYDTTLTDGLVSKVYSGSWYGSQTFKIVEHTATVNKGNSGGPLIDYCGNVVGVNTRIFLEDNGGNVSSSSETLINFLNNTNVRYKVASKTCDPDDGPSTTSEVTSGISSGPLGLPTWGIVVIALATIGAIGGGVAFATRQKSSLGPEPIYGDSSLVGAAVAPKSTGPAALQLHAKLPSGEVKSFDITSAQLRDGASIGRSGSATITIDSPKISREHARIKLDGRKLLLVDMGSTNGTEIGGKKLAPKAPQQINTSSAVSFGNVQIKLSKP